MPIRGEDLPKSVRDKYGLVTGRTSKKSRAGTGHAVPCSGTCGCGAPFPRYSEFEKHAAETGHSRWRIDLPD